MIRKRWINRVLRVLPVVLLAEGCGHGDAPTAPAPPEPARPTTVTVSPPTAELTALGATVQLAAEVRDQNARVMADLTVTWSSGETSVATVDASGLVTAVANGTATITATSGSASGSATVTVAQKVSEVSVSPGTVELMALGATVQLTAEARDSNGHVVAEAEFAWESSDTSVATVDEAGLVTAVGTGTAQVTATSSGAAGTAVLQVVLSYTLSGTVTDGRRAGLAVPGATVWLVNGMEQSRTTDAGGRYRFPNISGRVKVTVDAPGYRNQTAEVTVGSDATLDFTLKHTGIPPFQGTVWVTPDIIDASDPTSFRNVTYTGRGYRWFWDRRAEVWVEINVFLFNVEYADQQLEFEVHPEFGSVGAARSEVERYAPAIGRLPTVLLSGVKGAEISAVDEVFAANVVEGFFHIYTGSGDRLIREGFLEEMLFHEAGHISMDVDHASSLGWRAAQRADGVSISEYASDFPDREDIAESILPYFAVRYRPDRLTTSVRWDILRAIPNRLAYFDDQQLDMSPYTPAYPTVVTRPNIDAPATTGHTVYLEDPPIPPRRNRR